MLTDNMQKRPMLEMLSQPFLERIMSEAMEVLSKVGIFVENKEALALLLDAGAQVDRNQRVLLPEDLVWRCVRSAPALIQIFDRTGKPAMHLEGLNVHFDPGSAALKILDHRTGEARAPRTKDLIDFARLTDALPHYAAQSTGIVPADVPEQIADRYRLFIALLSSKKPVVTGTFAVEGFAVMKEMLSAVAGSEANIKAKPMAIFDACPSPPLKWSNLTTQSLVDCARTGLPAELVSMPLLGATAPVSMAGSLVQHTAENLSGVTIHQLAGPGSPIIYGGSPGAVDMRSGTIAMGSIEAMMLIASYAQIGRFLGLPTHGYLCMSDTKVIDAQAGLESGMGAMAAALSGVNVVSGAGMLEFENCQSLEKLVIDNDICGMTKRLVTGIIPRKERLAEDLFGDLKDGQLFLTSPRTLEYMREEVSAPGSSIDRQPRELWQSKGGKDALAHAHDLVNELLAKHKPEPLPDDIRAELVRIMSAEARRHGMDRLSQDIEQ
jgi:trimethylamine--corrinoid protein Co-methyltransferase